MNGENNPSEFTLSLSKGEMDRTVVELAIQDYTKPMGVATFRLGEDAPEQYNRILPDTRGLNALIQEDE